MLAGQSATAGALSTYGRKPGDTLEGGLTLGDGEGSPGLSDFRYCVGRAGLKLCPLLQGSTMPNRREFLQTGAAVSAFAVNGLLAHSAHAVSAARAGIRPHKAIYDDRYAEGHEFAATIGATGVPTRALDSGDITRFWYEELDLKWRTEPVAIAGFTQFGPLFCVETLAAERRMRVALRVEHGIGPGGMLVHEITASGETVALAERLAAEGLAWPTLMAVLASRYAADSAPPIKAKLSTPGSPARLAPSVPDSRESPIIHYYTPRAEQQGYGIAHDGPLYSWLVAPRERG